MTRIREEEEVRVWTAPYAETNRIFKIFFNRLTKHYDNIPTALASITAGGWVSSLRVTFDDHGTYWMDTLKWLFSKLQARHVVELYERVNNDTEESIPTVSNYTESKKHWKDVCQACRVRLLWIYMWRPAVLLCKRRTVVLGRNSNLYLSYAEALEYTEC